MKYLIYAIRTELSNKASFAVNIISTALVIYFILQYFGSYTGVLSSKYAESRYYVLSSKISSDISDNDLERLSDVNGFETAEIRCGNIGGDFYGAELLGIIGQPLDSYMFEGDIAIEKNADPNSVYIPYSFIVKLGKGVGDEIVLKKHKVTGVFLFDGKPGIFSPDDEKKDDNEDDEDDEDKDMYEPVSFKICGTFGDGLTAPGGGTLAFPGAAVLKYFKPAQIEIRLDAFRLTEAEFKEASKEIEDIFGNVTDLVDVDKVLSGQIASMRWQSGVCFAIGMICIMFMYSYILSKRVRRFSVCSLCGASKKDITIITVIGCILNYTVSFFLALLLGFAANRLVFQSLLEYNTMDVSFENGLSLFFLFLAVYLAVTVFYAVDFLKNTTVTVYRRSE